MFRVTLQPSISVANDGAGLSDLLLHFDRLDAYALLAAWKGLINYNTVRDSENRIIFAQAHVQAGFNARTALADQDVARYNRFTRIDFDAQAL